MATKIRLLRMGRKKRPFYRMVVVDSRKSALSGSYIDALGHYDPMTEPVNLKIDEEKALDWLSKGALPSDTAKSLLSKHGIMEKFHKLKNSK